MPPSANSNFPICPPFLAPVKAPFSYPNNSLSNRLAGIEPQFTDTNGPDENDDALWMACANSSLPVPLSPSMSVLLSNIAVFIANDTVLRKTGFEPKISAKVDLASQPPTRLMMFLSDCISRIDTIIFDT